MTTSSYKCNVISYELQVWLIGEGVFTYTADLHSLQKSYVQLIHSMSIICISEFLMTAMTGS